MELDTIKAMNAWVLRQGPRPAGFRYLSQGCERLAYLGSDGWVYKFEKLYTWDYYDYTRPNMNEWNGYKRLRRAKRLPEGWALPHTELIRFGKHRVIKMQYIQGRGVAYKESDWVRPRIWDLGPTNARKCSTTGVKYLIDMQC